MADSFLTALQVGPNVFLLGGRLSPISIRDQMIRGAMLIDRAWEQGLIAANGSEGRNQRNSLLVIGAGAGGTTAAIRAAALGVHTTLVDGALIPFALQARCRTRWVDPTQYDWPMAHWTQGRFPWSRWSMPLPWRADRASRVAMMWTPALANAVHYLPLTLQLPLNSPNANPPYTNYGMVAICTGFGNEICKLPRSSHTGYRFWDNDPFEQPNAGVPNNKRNPKVLISGSGDGALQDFLRLTTGLRSAAEILRQVQIPPAFSHEIQCAEDQALRAHSWGEAGAFSKDHDHVVQSNLHDIHRDVIDRLWLVPQIQFAARSVLRKSADLPEVHLVHSCTHFSNYYGLNRFLVLLLAKAIESATNRNPIRPQLRLSNVSGCPHNPSPQACHGVPHDVTLDSWPTCSTAHAQSTPTEQFDVVIIRHGVDFSRAMPLVGSGRPSGNPAIPSGFAQTIAHPRQMLPYELTY